MTEITEQCAIDIAGLSYRYPSQWLKSGFQAITDLSLQVKPGESFGFLGHNGAGKTTTIKCILGLIAPTKGQISIFGKSSRQTSARLDLGYLPEQPYFYDSLTVFETLKFYGQLSGIASSDLKSRIDHALASVKLTGRASSPIRALSKGLTQRLAMAQAIIARPKLLILDEPFSGLDPIGRHEFRELILSLKNEGATIFMSSHILSDVESICDRASIMSKGELKGVFDLRNLTTSLEQLFVNLVTFEESTEL